MAYNYAPLVKNANTLIASFGQSATLTQTTAGTRNKVTGAITGTTDNTETLNVVPLPADDSASAAMDKSFQQDLVKGLVTFALIAAYQLTYTPEIGDDINFSSTDYEIVALSPLSPSGATLLYYAYLRKK